MLLLVGFEVSKPQPTARSGPDSTIPSCPRLTVDTQTPDRRSRTCPAHDGDFRRGPKRSGPVFGSAVLGSRK